MQMWSGSAKKLTGNCVMVCAFVSTEDNPWSEEDREKVLEDSRTALDWISEKASDYEAEVSFEIDCLNQDDDDAIIEEYPELDTPYEKKQEIVQTILVDQLEYESVTDF